MTAFSWLWWLSVMMIWCVVDINQMQALQQAGERLVLSVAVVDVDPALALFRPSQQKWVSSLELCELPRDPRSNSKTVPLGQSLCLQVNFCEKNRAPIFEVDFLPHAPLGWVALKAPPTLSDRFGPLSLCYRTEDDGLSEPLTDIEILITERRRTGEEKEVFVLPSGYKIVSNNPIAHSYLIYKRMRSLFEQTFKPMLLERLPEEGGPNHSLLPMFCFPEGIRLSRELKGFITFTFVLTQQNGDRVYANCLCFKQALEEPLKAKLNLPAADRVYYEKAVCLLSPECYTDEFAECLKHLYRLSMSKNDVPFHRVIKSFAESMVLPREVGVNGLSYSYGGSNINFDTHGSYPVVSERAIYCVFKFLPLQCIISVFEAVLLEKKIIFVSQSRTILGFAIEAFLAFVFPFRWEHVLIPILPAPLKEYLAAPVPIIVGITPAMVDNTIEPDTIIVQMDTGTVLNDEDLPPLPDKLEKQLRRRLEQFEVYDEAEVREYLENPESTYIFKMQEVEHPEFQGALVRDCFYEFMLTLMKNYKKFWKVQKYKEGKDKQNSSLSLTEPQLLNDLFKVQDFLSDLGMSKVGSFGYKFTEGTIFTSFVERKHQFADDPELRFFDDSLDRKRSNKNAKLIEKIANIRYIVAKHPEPEQVKAVFAYDRFPSILGRELVREEEIAVDVDSVDEEELECLQEFLDEEFKLNHKLFRESDAKDLADYRIESLLLQRYRMAYLDFRERMESSTLSNSKAELFKSTLGGSKLRNSRQAYDKLKFFEKLYFEQMREIGRLLEEWPYENSELLNIREIEKREYLRLLRSSQALAENELYAVFEQGFGVGSRNYQTLIKNGTKVVFLESVQGMGSSSGKENLRGSRRRLKYTYEVYMEHSKLKAFINKVIPVHAHALFAFIVEKIQQENASVWTLEVLLEWRAELIRRLHSRE